MENDSGPYKATRLWNDIVEDFLSGVSVGSRRRFLKTYENCFSAQEAIDWLQDYLSKCRGIRPNITRSQVVQLLQKFMENDILHPVKADKKKKDFKDDSCLYRFNDNYSFENTNYVNSATEEIANRNRIPFKDRTSETVKSHKNVFPAASINSYISSKEIADTWKVTLLKRLLTLLNVKEVNNVLDEKCIDGNNILNNIYRINKNGIVCLTDKTDDIPPWIKSAMKCLNNWPNATGTGSCLPNYPGFERDVFSVVQNYFANMGKPLIPYFLYHLVIYINEYFKTMSRHYHFKGGTISSPKNVSSIVFVESLMEDCGHDNLAMSECSDQDKNSISYVDNEIYSSGVYDVDTYFSKHLEKWKNLCELYYETEFFNEVPETKLVLQPHDIGSSSKKFKIPHQLLENDSLGYFDFETSRNLSSHSAHKNFIHSADNLLLNASQSKIEIANKSLSFDQLDSRIKVPNIPSHQRTLPRTSTHKCLSTVNRNQMNFASFKMSEESLVNSSNASTMSSITRPCHLNNMPTTSTKAEFKKFYSNFERSIENTESNKINFQEEYCKLLQLALLLLPTVNRRHLHLLLRMMKKILTNTCVNLDPKDKLQKVIEAFSRSILCAEKESENQEIRNFEIVTFLVENCDSLFQPCLDLKDEVEKKLYSLYQKRMSSANCPLLTYCEQVPLRQYEDQKETVSKQALLDLFFNILNDDSLSNCVKRKKLKQFKENYPDIYFENLDKVKCEQPPLRSGSSFLKGLKKMRI